MFPRVNTEVLLYIYGGLCPIFVGYSFLGQDVLNFIGVEEFFKDRLSITISILLAICVVTDLALVYLLHISIQQRSINKLKTYWLAHGILFFVLNCLYAVKLSKTPQGTDPPHISIDIMYFIWFWTFTFQAPLIFKFRETLKMENDFPVTGKMFGIQIKKLLVVQGAFQWIFLPNMLYLQYALNKDAPQEMLRLNQPGAIGYYVTLTIRTVTISVALTSIILFIGVKKKNIFVLKSYYIAKIFLFIILSAGTVTTERVLRIQVQKLTTHSSFVYRACLRMIFCLELCEIKYYINLLRLRKQFPIEIVHTTENFSQIFSKDVKTIIKTVRIPNWRLQLDVTMEFNKVAEGTFGNVYKGSLRRGFCGLKTIPVAVKVLKLDKAEGFLQPLISEMKSLLVTQSHQNLVQAFGIIWKQKAKGIVMEYCSLGSLDKQLRAFRKSIDFPYNITNIQLKELEIWSFQIASAMEFIESRHIIHGDLATRNVLLDKNRTAKITDFGMSMRLYNYQIYARSNSSVLPWRWMAPESLTDLKFSTKSDVWSYGVTLWELYTFGDIPWSVLAWSSDFVDQLKNGARLQKPLLSSDYLYEYIMKRCWHLNPDSRISFRSILQNLGYNGAEKGIPKSIGKP